MIKKKLIKIIDNISQKKITDVFLDLIDVDTVFLNYHRVLSNDEFQNKNRPDDDLVVSAQIFDKQVWALFHWCRLRCSTPKE